MPEENDAPKTAEANATEGVDGSEGEKTPTTSYDELKAFVETRGIKSPDDFTDFMSNLETTEHWKKQYGDSQNQVGELRRELEAIRSQMGQNFEGYGENPTVNIKDVVRDAVTGVLSDMQRTQQEAQMKYFVERNDLMKRPGWKDVQPHFDKAMMDPQVQYAIQSGRLTQEKLYSTINERVLLSRVNTFVNQVPEGALKTPPPNTETSDRILQPIPDEEAKKQRMQKAVENQDVEALLQDLLPDGDPIVNY